MTIDEILDEVERLDQKGTPGPWVREMVQDGEILPDGTGYAGDWYESNGIARAAGPDNDEHDVGEVWSGSDAALVAAYRSHAPALAAEVRRLRDKLAQSEAAEVRLRLILEQVTQHLSDATDLIDVDGKADLP